MHFSKPAETHWLEEGQNLSEQIKSSETNRIDRTQLQKKSVIQEKQHNSGTNFVNFFLMIMKISIN